MKEVLLKKRPFSVADHLFAWVSYLAVFYYTNWLTNKSVSIVALFLLVLLFAGIFYGVLGILKKYYWRKKNGWGWMLWIGVMVLIYEVGYRYIYDFLPLWDLQIYKEERVYSERAFLQTVLLVWLRFSTYAFVYYLFLMERMSAFEHTEGLKKNHALKVGKLEYELAFLNVQISPHFIGNALNNIYGRLLTVDEALAENIVELNEVIGYTLQGDTKDCGLARIEQEVEALRMMMKLSLTDESKESSVRFTETIEVPGMKVPYSTLLTLFENILNHGVVGNHERPVSMHLEVMKERLLFSTVNTIRRSRRVIRSRGIGLTNLRRRLDILFPDKHLFEAYEKEGVFYTTLEIQYN